VTQYETLFIVHPEQGGSIKDHVERLKKIVQDLGGTVTHVEEWGLRDLAYRIQKQRKGHYSLVHYQASAAAVVEVERYLKLSDGVMRYLTVRPGEDQESAAQQGPKNIADKRMGGSEESLGKQEGES
jgi:small subunit ribosomal protein S6